MGGFETLTAYKKKPLAYKLRISLQSICAMSCTCIM